MTLSNAILSLEIHLKTNWGHTDKLLSSAKLCNKTASIKKNKSLLGRLKKRGSKNRPPQK